MAPSFPSPSNTQTSVLFIKSLKRVFSSPLGGLPHLVAVVSVEVGGQLLLVVHAAGPDHVREAQRPEGQRLHCPLNQLDMTTSACCVCLDEGGEDSASSHMSLIIPAANDCAFDLLFLYTHVVNCPLLNAMRLFSLSFPSFPIYFWSLFFSQLSL